MASSALSVEAQVNGPARARVSIHTRAMWRIRLVRGFPRYLLCAAALAGLAASARNALAPPRPIREIAATQASAAPDRAAEGYAVLFARRYLSWNAAEPQSAASALKPLAGQAGEAGQGLVLPASGQQHVEWAEVVQEREPGPGRHVYTVAAQTDAEGLLYLTVGVARDPGGALALTGYPAFVGAPAAGDARSAPHLREVGDPELTTVVERALRNYLADAPAELAADLAPGARVSLPTMALTLGRTQRVDWSADGRSVLVVLQAQDARSVQYTLAYELDVTRAQGRWEISAVQMDPDA